MLHDKPVAAAEAVPLFVDVDGTLVRADITLESLVTYMRGGVAAFLLGLIWLLRGRTFTKTMLARRRPVDPAILPYRAEVLALIEQARQEGRPVILASASHWRNVRRIARHIGVETVIATNARNNLKSQRKLTAIRSAIGPDGSFDYVGDCGADVCLWTAAREGYSAGRSGAGTTILANPPRPFLNAAAKAMRPHQWAKNALVMVPIATAGLLGDPVAIARGAAATIALSLLASAIYIINDLLDIDADRQHHKKRTRPLAAGDISIPQALVLSGALAIAGLGIGLFMGGLGLFLSLLAYAALTTAYSLRVKAAAVADVITLAALYTIRIWIGAVAVGVVLSEWLLLFAVFFFLSLAYLKRYIELREATVPDHQLVAGRGYTASDLDVVMVSGLGTGLCSILVLALFANDPEATLHYASPQLLWFACLPLLYWINRVWMMARRGEVDGDPVAFALKDRRSILLGGMTALTFLAAQQLSLPG
jgi:4-hydroxybenzoate polyprenyltransferase